MNEALLEAELRRDEGVRLIAYRDSVGLWTIGIGHLLGPTCRMVEITGEECIALYRYDRGRAEVVARGLLTTFDALDDVRQRALVNMAFNLGGRLGGFHNFLAAVAAEDWEKAGVQMLASKWAAQVGQRAVRLHKMVTEGVV